MKIVNLTRYPIILQDENGKNTLITPSGKVAYITGQEWVEEKPEWSPVKVKHLKYPVRLVNLPDPQPDTVYLVYADVLEFARGRTDVFAVDKKRGTKFDTSYGGGGVLVAYGLIGPSA